MNIMVKQSRVLGCDFSVCYSAYLVVYENITFLVSFEFTLISLLAALLRILSYLPCEIIFVTMH